MHFHPLEADGELFRDSSVSEKEWTAEGAQSPRTSGRQELGEAPGRAPASGDAAGGGQGPTDSLLLPGRDRQPSWWPEPCLPLHIGRGLEGCRDPSLTQLSRGKWIKQGSLSRFLSPAFTQPQTPEPTGPGVSRRH